MPPRGAPQKPPGQAVNRNQHVHEWLEVEDVQFEGGPDLPERMSASVTLVKDEPAMRLPWHQRTRDKWDVWRAMPHCKYWGPAEWDYALDSIEIAGLFHHTGEQKYATELRNREKVLGTTLDYRRALRIRYVEPKTTTEGEGDGASVTNIADYMNL